MVTPARRCARPDCAAEAGATLTYGYAERSVWLDGLRGDPDPNAYDLCGAHARRLRVPAGWVLVDRRTVPAARAPMGRGAPVPAAT